jgi:uncharacterized protein DUF2784
MSPRIAADTIVAIHFAFIVFVVSGGLLALWRPGFAVLHLPALAWGAWTEFTGAICPLTPLENAFRKAAGEAGYPGGFIHHYMVPLIYPEALTPRTQLAYGVIVVAINAGVYALVWRKSRRRRSPVRGP